MGCTWAYSGLLPPWMDPTFGLKPENDHAKDYDKYIEDLENALGEFGIQDEPYDFTQTGPPIGLIEEARSATAIETFDCYLENADRREIGGNASSSSSTSVLSLVVLLLVVMRALEPFDSA